MKELMNLIREPQSVNVVMSAEDLTDFAKAVAKATIEGMVETKEEDIVWLTPDQVAARLNKSLVTLNRWEKDNYLKPFRFGRKCRYRESDVVKVEQAERGGKK